MFSNTVASAYIQVMQLVSIYMVLMKQQSYKNQKATELGAY